MINSKNRKIKFHNFNYGPRSALIISHIMLMNKSFCTYYLGDNFFGNEGIVKLAQTLKLTDHIIALDVSTNNITLEGAVVLFESLL